MPLKWCQTRLAIEMYTTQSSYRIKCFDRCFRCESFASFCRWQNEGTLKLNIDVDVHIWFLKRFMCVCMCVRNLPAIGHQSSPQSSFTELCRRHSLIHSVAFVQVAMAMETYTHWHGYYFQFWVNIIHNSIHLLFYYTTVYIDINSIFIEQKHF